MNKISSDDYSLDPDNLDPVFVHARREAIVIIVIFAITAIWSLSVCYLDGYIRPEQSLENIPLVLGMPRWVFWGIFAPWIFADLATVWFCFFYMTDDDLGEDQEEEDLEQQRDGGSS